MNTVPRPYGLLAELSYECPLHCPYCSNPASYPGTSELATEDWIRVMEEAADLGVLQVGLSGGEPLMRRDLTQIVLAARKAGLYSNLISSGVGLDARRSKELRDAGLDAIQISFQSAEALEGDRIAGTRAHEAKLAAAGAAKEAGLAFGINIVLHRSNIDHLNELVEFAAGLGAERLELANVQYYGWAFRNRAALLPTREQIASAREGATIAKQKYAGQMEIFYVVPDYFHNRPKPCMHGWGRRQLTVNPAGDVLPCPTAGEIPGLRFENIRERSLQWIWQESESFNKFRGTEWMPEPCRGCPQREIDFGGCRCQAALLTGDPAATDPVCELSPHRRELDEWIEGVSRNSAGNQDWDQRIYARGRRA